MTSTELPIPLPSCCSTKAMKLERSTPAMRQEFKPLLVLADVVMPEMNGVDAAREISRIVPGCKVMLFSGHADGGKLSQKARSQGYNFEFIEKPTHPAEMLLKIRFALAV